MLSFFSRETSLAALGPISYGEPGHMAALRPFFCCGPVIKYGLYLQICFNYTKDHFFNNISIHICLHEMKGT